MKKSARDITVIVPAFNEEHNLVAAVTSITHALRNYSDRYTILIVNDGSTDKTKEIAQRIGQKDSRIRIIHNDRNRGLGYSIRHALPQIKTRYVTIFPGDNDMSAQSLTRLVDEAEAAELVTGYMVHAGNRSWKRRLLSRVYITGMNRVFGLRLRYYNGPFLCDTARLHSLVLHSNGLDVFAELKIRMIRAGCSVKEIPFEHTGRKYGTSKAVTLKSVIQTIRTTGLLVRDMYWHKSP